MRVERKWRPGLGLLVACLCLLLVALPVLGMLSVRLVDNRFLRETEAVLQVQAAMFAEAYRMAFLAEMPDPDFGTPVDAEYEARQVQRYDPLQLQLTGDRAQMLPPQPDPVTTSRPPGAPYDRFAETLATFAAAAKRRTLAGYIATDHTGLIIATSGKMAGSFAQLDEVRTALAGRETTLLRLRGDPVGWLPISSFSRNTNHRVFVVQPVIVGKRVIGSVMLSRTPTNMRKFLSEESSDLMKIVGIMLAGAALVGGLFWRLISVPILGLAAQSRAVAAQTRPLPEPLGRYGVREIAELGDSILAMAQRLDERSKMVETYTAHVTHELKSPTTAIVGASELLETASDAMPVERRRKLVRSINEQGVRMNTLLERLRTLTKAKLTPGATSTPIHTVTDRLRSSFGSVTILLDAPEGSTVPLGAEQADIVLVQLISNAMQHGADEVRLIYDDADPPALSVTDNGTGIDPANIDKLTEPFFTTRRNEGGTGMGLAIAAAIVEASGGQLRAKQTEAGARFVLEWQEMDFSSSSK